jgi:hypothetical protein
LNPPSEKGNRAFKLKFHHANYPEGVRDKTYNLQTIERGETYSLSKSADHQPVRILKICEITAEWLSIHFGMDVDDGVDLQKYLDHRIL